MSRNRDCEQSAIMKVRSRSSSALVIVGKRVLVSSAMKMEFLLKILINVETLEQIISLRCPDMLIPIHQLAQTSSKRDFVTNAHYSRRKYTQLQCVVTSYDGCDQFKLVPKNENLFRLVKSDTNNVHLYLKLNRNGLGETSLLQLKTRTRNNPWTKRLPARLQDDQQTPSVEPFFLLLNCIINNHIQKKKKRLSFETV